MNRCHTADRAEFRRRLLSGHVFQDSFNNVRTGYIGDDAQPAAAVRTERARIAHYCAQRDPRESGSQRVIAAMLRSNMTSNEERPVVEFGVRKWQPSDDSSLVEIMQRQMQADPGWPPGYARGGDLAKWLGEPTTLGRWVAAHVSGALVGHVGSASVHDGPIADLWCAALCCDVAMLAEICRLVVDPRWRRYGIADLMTRAAIRATLESGLVPVANALDDRNASLRQMVAAGWRNVGRATSPKTGLTLVALVPPQKLVDLAMGPGRAKRG